MWRWHSWLALASIISTAAALAESFLFVSVLDKGHTHALIKMACELSKQHQNITLFVAQEIVDHQPCRDAPVSIQSLGPASALLQNPPKLQQAGSRCDATSPPTLLQKLAEVDRILLSAQQPTGESEHDFAAVNEAIGKQLIAAWSTELRTQRHTVVCGLLTTGCTDAAESLGLRTWVYTLYSPRFIFPHLSLPLPSWLATSDPFLPWTWTGSPVPWYAQPFNTVLRYTLGLPLRFGLNLARTATRQRMALPASSTWLAPGGPHRLLVGSAFGFEHEMALPGHVTMIGTLGVGVNSARYSGVGVGVNSARYSAEQEDHQKAGKGPEKEAGLWQWLTNQRDSGNSVVLVAMGGSGLVQIDPIYPNLPQLTPI